MGVKCKFCVVIPALEKELDRNGDGAPYKEENACYGCPHHPLHHGHLSILFGKLITELFIKRGNPVAEFFVKRGHPVAEFFVKRGSFSANLFAELVIKVINPEAELVIKRGNFSADLFA